MSNNYLLPLAYLGPIYYYAILKQKKCLLEKNEFFIKQSIRNRCEIYNANGRLKLSIPKKRKSSSKTAINKIEISYSQNWQKIHWNSIVSSYNSSPYFEYYKNNFLSLYLSDNEEFLFDFNLKLQRILMEILEIEKKINFTTHYNKSGSFTDLRNLNWSNIKIKKYDQVFMEKYGFQHNLCVLDLIFNLGPNSSAYLDELVIDI